MNKYNVVASYCLAIDKIIIAKTEEEAKEKMQIHIDSLSNEEFTRLGEPQLAEMQVTEEK